MTAVLIGLTVWLVLSIAVALGIGRAIRLADERDGARGLRGDR